MIDGPDRLAGTAALNALVAGFNDPNIDDNIVILTFKVESNNALQAGFSGTPTSGAAPLSVFFTDISIGYPETWQWDFGDSSPNSTLQNPNHTYSNAGNYTVTLTASNAYGNSSLQKTDYIYVTPPPPFLSGWSYRKLHTISGSTSTLTDYQVRFKVHNTTGTDSGENV